jgi:O-6-methylguanine DNA methyltransferase
MTMASKFRLERFASPIGGMLIVTDDDDVTRAVEFEDHLPRLHQLLRIHYGTYELADSPGSGAAIHALRAYFGGDLAAIEAVAVQTEGTAFQRDVWRALRDIPAGQTTSYGQLAVDLGRPGASRAVGLANGSNPVSLIVPCHRVIGANGALTGYGGGIERKRWLLEHERVNRSSALRSPPVQVSGVQVSGVQASGVPASGIPVGAGSVSAGQISVDRREDATLL